MGKLRIARKATKGKGKRWKKGNSSSSNPEHRKFRENARPGFFNSQKRPGNLTEDLLAKHDAFGHHHKSTSEEKSDTSDTQSIGGRTFDTFASGFSNCTNASFSRLMESCKMTSVLHKEMLAVLAAVTEVIKEKGGKETETEYFAALMLTLETIESNESRAAVIGLLGMVMRRLPLSILKIKFSDVSKVLISLLGQYAANSDQISLLRSLIGCLSILLRAQETAVWSNPSTLHIYNTVLSFSTHPKPKVRKAGQHAVCSILKSISISAKDQAVSSHHPATAATAKYCIQKIEECGGSGHATTTLHVIGLLREILGCFSKSEIKCVSETLLRVMLLSSPLVKCCTLNALGGLFKSKPKQMTPDLVAQLINALYDYQPSLNDNQALIAWLTTMHYALLHLESLNQKLCLDHSVKFFTTAANCWLSDKQDVIDTVTTILKDLLLHCLVSCSEQVGQSLLAAGSNITPSHKIFQSLEGALKYQFHSVWGNVLQVLAVAFQVFGKQCHTVMVKCLQTLADLRDTHNFAFTSELDKALGIAVHVMGPEVILQAIPVKINTLGEKFDFPRSWLIPVIRDNVQETKLSFFTTFFLPLATQLKNKAIQLEKQERKIEAKTYDILQSQVWSMLPGFCTMPTDLEQSFKGIAKTLGITLNERPDLRLVILAAIRNLIKKNADNKSSHQELAKFAKNFLPILFNLYTTEPETTSDNGTRLAVFDTIKMYLKITDSLLVSELFEKAISRMEQQGVSSTSFYRHAIVDLYRALLPHLNAEQVSRIYNLSKSLFQDEDRTLQKKAYRVMEEICQCQSNHCIQVVTKEFSDLKEILLTSLSKANPSSKAPRLRCLTHIISHLKEEDNDFTSIVIPEAVLCVKESSEKARTAAFKLLIEIGKAEQRWLPESSDAVNIFLNKVMTGFLGTPHVVSATLTAVARLFYEFKDKISTELTQLLVQKVCLLLTAKGREIVQSSLAFVKSLFDALSSDDLLQYLPDIIKSLTSASEDCQRHFRFKVKTLLVRFVRKFGIELITKLVPESHQKVLTNIRKTENRKARARSAARDTNKNDVDDEEDENLNEDRIHNGGTYDDIDRVLQDSDSDDNEPVQSTHRNKKGLAYIEEAGEEIVDFLDQKVSQKISAVRPSEKMKQKVKHNFKTAPDGRLIITEDDEENKPARKADDSMDYLMEAAEFAKKGQKRKRPSDSDDEEPAVFPGDKKGIHRKNPRNLQDGSTYKANKADGDLKKKGKHEPYAYIPLNPQALNKRKKAKFSKQFSNVVRGAKKGAAKGARAKNREKNRKC